SRPPTLWARWRKSLRRPEPFLACRRTSIAAIVIFHTVRGRYVDQATRLAIPWKQRATCNYTTAKAARGRLRTVSSAMTNDSQAQRATVHYSGHVQGVGFRYAARSIAGKYAVTGFVQNLSDGRVRLVVEGNQR